MCIAFRREFNTTRSFSSITNSQTMNCDSHVFFFEATDLLCCTDVTVERRLKRVGLLFVPKKWIRRPIEQTSGRDCVVVTSFPLTIGYFWGLFGFLSFFVLFRIRILIPLVNAYSALLQCISACSWSFSFFLKALAHFRDTSFILGRTKRRGQKELNNRAAARIADLSLLSVIDSHCLLASNCLWIYNSVMIVVP